MTSRGKADDVLKIHHSNISFSPPLRGGRGVSSFQFLPCRYCRYVAFKIFTVTVCQFSCTYLYISHLCRSSASNKPSYRHLHNSDIASSSLFFCVRLWDTFLSRYGDVKDGREMVALMTFECEQMAKGNVFGCRATQANGNLLFEKYCLSKLRRYFFGQNLAYSKYL
jgi:hypothetical protein